jgi:putative membrane protein
MHHETVLRSATFDPKLKTYWLLLGCLIMLPTVVGVLAIPIWLLGVGAYFNGRRFDSMHAELTDRSLHLRKGFIFKVDKTIPLDKIQDVALHHGPLLNSLGLASLTIETAGGSAQAGAAATLVGVVDAVSFRDAILEQREAVTGQKALPAPTGDQDVLIQIRDSLERIETLLARG